MKLIPTILCGGAGSRLWPVSRELHPKPFIRLADGQSLLQKAFLRGAQIEGAVGVITVTNRELFFKTNDEFREVNSGTLPTSFILEPVGRNTAAAVAAAALEALALHGPEAIMLVLPADHLVSDQPAFAAAVTQAIALAEKGRIVTFGVRPDAPETGYGYIEAEGNEVLRFVEKPNLELARQYLASGHFLWNSGMFCFAAGTIISEMQAHSPEILAAVRACMQASRKSSGEGFTQRELESKLFGAVPELSIDYAVMEKSARMAVVPCEIGWSDIGSWNAIGNLAEADGNGNRVEGGAALLFETRDCYIQSDGRVVGAVGLNNLIIIDTPDALLVADRNRAQDVKQVFTELKARGHEAHKVHRTVDRPWGTYTVLEEGTRFKIKRIEVKPGASLSLQMHHHRSEHWVIVSGVARVVNGSDDTLINTNESTYIPAGHRHRVENPGVLPLVMIEVQCGDYLGEDDIVRFDDRYGRV